MGYRPYRLVRDEAAKIVAGTIPKKVWKADRDSFMSYVMKGLLEMSSPTKVLDNNILVDEEMYVDNGCRMVFPESLALLEMLWRARMNVGLDDVDWSVLPPAFSVAWPDGEIDGVELRGCMVIVATPESRYEFGKKVVRRYLGTSNMGLDTVAPESGRGFYLTFFDRDPDIDDNAVYRCMIPEDDLKKCLTSEERFDEVMRGYNETDRSRLKFLGFNLDKAEGHAQYVMSRLVMRLMVYMQACPEMVHEGYPTRRGERSYRSRFSGEVKGTMIGVPEGLAKEHASPSTHWRQWHFRTYPRRKDGTKRKGIVAVSGTIVNADVDPVTAERQ